MSRPYVIQVGLPADHHSVPAEIMPKVQPGLDRANELFEAAGYDFKHSFISPEEGLGVLLDDLKKRVPDGVVIGFGLRGNPALSSTLEEVVNAIVEHAPKAKIMFNTTPDNGVQSAKKWVPIQG